MLNWKTKNFEKMFFIFENKKYFPWVFFVEEKE